MRVYEFFKDKDGDFSMTLLMLFLSFWPSTFVVLTQENENVFYAYIAAYTGLAANRQWATKKQQLTKPAKNIK